MVQCREVGGRSRVARYRCLWSILGCVGPDVRTDQLGSFLLACRVPSTDNPLEGLFRALKEWVQHRQARCMVFLDESTHFLSDWSAWYTKDVPDLYPNANQLEALATAQP